MFIDSSGSLGIEHAQDLRRAGSARRLARAAGAVATHAHVVRAFAARNQLGPIVNYRAY